MTIKTVADEAVTIGAAITAPLMTALVDAHVIGAQLATDIGAVVLAAVAAYRGGVAVQRRHAATELSRQ